MHSRHSRTVESGFTLVELSIVLVIIGLIIGGILKGQELIGNAEIKNVMARAQSIQTAVVGFSDKYGGLPGDLVNADELVPSCTVSPCNPTDQSAIGNGRIGNNVGNNYTGTVGDDDENVAFWQQLGASGFIGGVELGAGSTANFGSQFPEAATGGGFQVVFQQNTGRHLVRLSGSPTTINANSGALRPDQALQIDTKIDDGQPNGGTVFTNGSLSDAAGDDQCINTATNLYVAANPDQRCNLVIEID